MYREEFVDCAYKIFEHSNSFGVYSAGYGVVRQKSFKGNITINENIMKDNNGFYYYPDPNDKDTRVYVRQGQAGIEFRLWRGSHPEVWEKHDWLAYDIIKAAAELYNERGNAVSPLLLYDINVARALLK